MVNETIISRPPNPRPANPWTAEKIKQLRGKRTQEEFGKALRVPKNTVWRWEAGRVRPDSVRGERLSKLAAKETFTPDWQLAGSAELLGDLEEASRHLSKHFQPSLRNADL